MKSRSGSKFRRQIENTEEHKSDPINLTAAAKESVAHNLLLEEDNGHGRSMASLQVRGPKQYSIPVGGGQ